MFHVNSPTGRLLHFYKYLYSRVICKKGISFLTFQII
nr:MAG TPA: hypothetical protein [Crassvirales sp.]